MQLLHSSHVRERGKALLRSFLVGSVWSGFVLGQVHVVFVGVLTVMVNFSGIVLIPLWSRFVNVLSLTISFAWIKAIGLGACCARNQLEVVMSA